MNSNSGSVNAKRLPRPCWAGEAGVTRNAIRVLPCIVNRAVAPSDDAPLTQGHETSDFSAEESFQDVSFPGGPVCRPVRVIPSHGPDQNATLGGMLARTYAGGRPCNHGPPPGGAAQFRRVVAAERVRSRGGRAGRGSRARAETDNCRAHLAQTKACARNEAASFLRSAGERLPAMTSNSGSSVMRFREVNVMPQSLSGEVGHWRGDAHLLTPQTEWFSCPVGERK